MIYKILNKLFGWDYITWSNSAADGVARIHVDGAGKVYYWRYRVTKVADPIVSAEDHFWLTCSPTKYLPAPEQDNE